MNGVRRFLGGAISPQTSPPSPQESLAQSTPPLVIGGTKPSWPPQPASPVHSLSNSPLSSPKTTTAALFLRKDKQKPLPPPLPTSLENVGNTSSRSSSGSILSPTRSPRSYKTPTSALPPLPTQDSMIAGPSSPRVLPPTRKSTVPPREPDWKRPSSLTNTRDELLISLLASEAVVDSREFEILSSEDVEELKKEQQVLTSRLGAMSKRLSLETKIRDAAVSLTKVNASHKKVSKKTDEQLEAANRRVEAAQKELWRVADRANEVNKKLLEHRAAVLSFSVRNLEKKIAPTNGLTNGHDSGYTTPDRGAPMSPVSSASTSSRSRFDGAHLYAGHADAVIPKRRRSPSMAASEITSLEDRLRAMTDALNAASKKQAEMARELSHLQLEKQEVETMMGMELQSAEETILALEQELPRLESQDEKLKELMEEKSIWERDHERLNERNRQIEELQERLEEMETRSGKASGAEDLLAEVRENNRRQLEQKESEIREFKAQWEEERAAWERDKVVLEEEKMEDLMRLQDEMDRLREEDGVALQRANNELDEGHAALRTLMQTHGIVVSSGDSSLQDLVLAISTHLQSVNTQLDGYLRAQEEWDSLRRKLEEDVRSGLDKQESMGRDIETVRREREEARRAIKSLEGRFNDHPDRFAALKSPTVSSLPTDGTDAGRIISLFQPIWALLPSPETRAAKFAGGQRVFRTGSPTPSSNPSSISELDVRSLKNLYDNRTSFPSSPNTTKFSIEAFASRVQALIADDRALIERLVRFAQAHDLLKKNAERAQKLAQESNNALETYQKQVKMLEDQNMSMSSKLTAFNDEIQELMEALERITAEKHEVEMQAAEQAETCRQLTEANNMLSARALTLAEEAASAPEKIKKQLEGQLAECRASLQEAQNEVDAMRMSEQSQRIALLDELNSMQTENGALRAQLRAVKK